MAVAVGVDVAKEFHSGALVHAEAGKALASRPVDNDPPAIQAAASGYLDEDAQRQLTMESARATLSRGWLFCVFDGGRYWDRTSDLFGVKQDAAPTLTCENENLQVVVGAVGCRSVPLEAVQRRSVQPVAPNLLPQSPPRDRR